MQNIQKYTEMSCLASLNNLTFEVESHITRNLLTQARENILTDGIPGERKGGNAEHNSWLWLFRFLNYITP